MTCPCKQFFSVNIDHILYVESIKAYFMSELKRYELVETRLHRLLSEKSEEVDILRSKCLGQETRLQELMTTNEITVKKLKDEVM